MLLKTLSTKWMFICIFYLGIIPDGIAAWVQKAPYGGTAKHRCTAFSINNKGYIGGGHINAGESVYYKDYWEYDPGTNTWTQIADFGGGYRYHSTAFNIGNFGYVGLGEDDDNTYHNDFWKYIPLINTWVQVADYPGVPRRGACSFVIDDLGYVGTGQTDLGYAVDFYSYDPSSNSWSAKADFIGEARNSAVAFAHNGKGYVGTGHILGDATKDFFEYDPLINSWIQKADVGILERQDATGFVVQGEAYIGTGNNVEGTDNYDDFWKYNFDLDTWTEVAEFDGQARRYMVSFVIGDVAFCGTGTNGTNLRDFWAFYPLLDIRETNVNDNYKIYPNPATDYIEIVNESADNFDQVLVSDLSGKILIDQKVFSSQKLTLDNFENGLYLITILDENKIIYTEKIQIQR
jgi:N-acetylneuraminic acid mutarotase